MSKLALSQPKLSLQCEPKSRNPKVVSCLRWRQKNSLRARQCWPPRYFYVTSLPIQKTFHQPGLKVCSA
ncbi:hypothetical protein Enr13x_26830 [Stieleria neptunia]|uniref:Uncharacterized protein n=1 Tax=Stieleria neptunia TaxID=2527979 RepID=A0A518HPR2_9BACT|nr:hypothetical protein Enr13x_26830 [Stieleria neptunia]